jgi:uncharacterized protein
MTKAPASSSPQASETPVPQGLSGIEAVLRDSANGPGPAPVDVWNPPYCGDIGLVIKADGTWLYQKSPIGRMPLVKLFARVLRHDLDGKHYLVTPVEKVDVKVEDAPFLAVEMDVAGEGREQVLRFRTNVDDVVTCGRHHPLRFVTDGQGGLKPYLRIRGRLDALVTRALYYDLVELAETEDTGALVLWSDGTRFVLKAE